MIPVEQTIVGGPNVEPDKQGNCLAACIASIFELPIEEAPHDIASDEWWSVVRQWMLARGLDIESVVGWPTRGDLAPLLNGYWIGVVPSLNLFEADGFPVSHAVVMHGRMVAHDPSTRAKRTELADGELWASYVIFEAEAVAA